MVSCSESGFSPWLESPGRRPGPHGGRHPRQGRRHGDRHAEPDRCAHPGQPARRLHPGHTKQVRGREGGWLRTFFFFSSVDLDALFTHTHYRSSRSSYLSIGFIYRTAVVSLRAKKFFYWAGESGRRLDKPFPRRGGVGGFVEEDKGGAGGLCVSSCSCAFPAGTSVSFSFSFSFFFLRRCLETLPTDTTNGRAAPMPRHLAYSIGSSGC